MRDNKGVVLFIVLGLILVVVVLAAVILSIISSQSRLTHHQVTRIRAYYAAKAGMNLAFDKLRRGDWTQDNTANKYYCINGNVDTGVTCAATQNDADIPYHVQIKVFPKNDPGINGTAKLEVKTDYTPQ